jgi:uncharacterized protein YjiS (DUF1127 family)
MTTTFQNTALPAAHSPLDGLVRRLAMWACALVTYLERRAAIKTLRELDDRLLRDIGLQRCDIEPAARGGFHPDIARV